MTRFVHYYPNAMGDSGVTLAMWSWARSMAAAGLDVKVLYDSGSPSEGARDLFVHDRDHVPHMAIAHRGRRRVVRHARSLGRELGPDDVLILHEGWVTANLVASDVARRRGVPYIVVPHGVYEPGWRRYLRPPAVVRVPLERRLLHGAAAIHLFFGTERAAVETLAPDARYVIAPTGHNVPAEGWRGGGGYLAWVGRYDPVHKGLDLLAEAMARLPAADRPEVRLHGYDYRGGIATLRALVDRLDLGRWISIGGPIGGAAKRTFLVEANGYVLPSRWESHSLALLEVLALGVPCLVTEDLHIGPLLGRWDAAVLTPLDHGSLANGLQRLASGEADAAGTRARDLVRAEFDPARSVQQLMAQLDELGIATRGRPATVS